MFGENLVHYKKLQKDFFYFYFFSSFTFQMLSWKSYPHPRGLQPALFPNPPTPAFWPWHSPVLGHIIFTRPRATPPSDDRLGHLLLYMQLEKQALGVPVSSYRCSSNRVTGPFSSLGTFSRYSIGDPVFHLIDDCEHPLLYLQGIA